MRIWTYGEIKEKIEADLDMQGEDFVDDDELLGYVNDAIDEAEAVIHNLNEDYFLASDVLSLTAGESDYAMPSDIYANKIRLMQWNDGSEKYEIKRIKLQQIPNVVDQDQYSYHILNEAATGPIMRLYPDARTTDSTSLTRYYIRNANRLTDSDSNCDIPEFVSFVIAHAKVQCAIKEMHPRLDYFQADLERQRQLMVDTLNEMVPDEDTAIDPDMSSYDEHN